jgi:hypothetical protein
MKVINTKARVISAGSVRFIPATPVECDIKKIAKMYPAIQGMLDSGELKVITEAEAVKAEEDLEAKTVVMLRKIASQKGIDTKGMKKDEIIKALKEV